MAMLTDIIDLFTDLYNVLWTPFEMLFKKARNYSNRVSNAVLLDDNQKYEFIHHQQVAEQLMHNPNTKSVLLCIENRSRNQQVYSIYGLSADNKYLWDMVVAAFSNDIRSGRNG